MLDINDKPDQERDFIRSISDKLADSKIIVQNKFKLGKVYSTVTRFLVFNSTNQDCSVRLLFRRSNKSEEEDFIDEINQVNSKDSSLPTNEYIPMSSFTFGLTSNRYLNVWSCQKFNLDAPWTCENLKVDLNIEFTGDLRYNNTDRVDIERNNTPNKNSQRPILKKDT